MEKFEFASGRNPGPVTTFNGPQFYKVYKEAEFLRSSDNVENILSRGHELRHKLSKVPAGQSIAIEGMMLERNTPLLVKKTGPGIMVEDYEFTYNRLSGLVAAYAFENRHRFPKIECSEAIALRLVWDNADQEKAKLYLSAVSGTEHFCDQFSFWPLVCALKKFKLGKLPEKLLIKMAKIKNDEGFIMAKVLRNNLIMTTRIWAMIPGSSPGDLQKMLFTASPELKCLIYTE